MCSQKFARIFVLMNSRQGEVRKTPFDHDPEGLAWAFEKSGMTQKEFAAALGKSPSLVSEILNGTRNATPALINDMARVLNCPRVVLERKRAS